MEFTPHVDVPKPRISRAQEVARQSFLDAGAKEICAPEKDPVPDVKGVSSPRGNMALLIVFMTDHQPVHGQSKVFVV